MCTKEPRNVVDRYAVAVVKENGCERTVVGHLPKKNIENIFFVSGRSAQCPSWVHVAKLKHIIN